MTVVQTVALVLVVIAATGVVLTPAPLRQALVLGVYGFALTLLFFTFQAPDVALSEIVITAVAMPLIILAALRKISEQERTRAKAETESSESKAGGT